MHQLIHQRLAALYGRSAPATGIGLFRLAYGLVTLQEIGFLLYFNHLIFDPIPFLDIEFPMIPFFLGAWGIVAALLTAGCYYRFAALGNYLFWLVFINFTPMQRDFDGGFDTFMTGAGFFLLFMPGNLAFSLDALRLKLSNPMRHYETYPKPCVNRLAYDLPVWVCLGFLYFDSAVHKLFAEHWRNGVGSWLPSTQPYYVSALDLSAFLNIEPLQKLIGYGILVFQFTFLFFFNRRRLRPVYWLFGIALHIGIILSLNIYPFGFGMLICYLLIVPFGWWRFLAEKLTAEAPALTVFFDEECPLCNRTVLIINHFDIFRRIDFKSAQRHAARYPALVAVGEKALLRDLYALESGSNRVHAGLETYIQILKKMRYAAVIGWMLGLPKIRAWAEQKYWAVADNRSRIKCGDACAALTRRPADTWYGQIFEDYAKARPKTLMRRLSKIVIALIVLQINSTLHYGLFYRLDFNAGLHPLSAPLAEASNALLNLSLTFFGITPHALYLHDHFSGYDRILAIAYLDQNGRERWLPFVNRQGRLLAPNWGRVHSMWANIAVTPTINHFRLQKFIMKVTAFWGRKLGLNLDGTVFLIKMKKIEAPTQWVYDLLHKNLSGEWRTVGTARWSGKSVAFDLPRDLNAL